MKQSRQGFTLIELLIVVAIIAILAAIAVPNFLEAQTRAKVSRVKADVRSLTTALELYYIDSNEYPPNPPPGTWLPPPKKTLPGPGVLGKMGGDASQTSFQILPAPETHDLLLGGHLRGDRPWWNFFLYLLQARTRTTPAGKTAGEGTSGPCPQGFPGSRQNLRTGSSGQ